MAASGDSHGTSGVFCTIGRVGPVRAAAVTLVAAIILKLVGVALDRGGLVAYILAGAAAGATIAKLFAEWSRRLHDTNMSAKWGVLLGLLAVVGVTLLTVSSTRADSPWLMTAAWIVIGVLLAAVLLRPGTRGDNRFGPPPTGALAVGGTASPAARRRAVIWALVATLGGALIGYTLIDISQGMRAAQDRTRLYVEGQGSR
ncbi:DUF805 domain-containing protein [Sphingomonas mucosissima]|uniref:DUF805 domain-containing protein n=1 Tax=Sphingomonas mucosissima TaxID=370959 RepID=A0A245ZFJ2_9SPHN|nr:DUF805 domain-containing protein [Sphingomonas mucosissima]OWK28499.1 hypothetical protein SPMU_27600 [Sphingomonas mucosissima]